MKQRDLYIKVTSLPLMQGLSAESLIEMQEHGALRLISMESEEGDIVMEGQPCKTLIMLMEGTLTCTTHGNGWTLKENIHAPEVIEEEAMWSLSQAYKHTYTPLTEGRLLIVDRKHVMHTLMHFDIFRINLLARMSTRLERLETQFIQIPANKPADKIMRFILSISQNRTFPKQLNIKMTTLADIIDETRLSVSYALRDMQQQGLLTLSRGSITIHQII